MSDTKCATYGREAYLLPNWARDPSKRCTTMMRTGRCTATMMQLQQVVQGNVALNVARVIAQWSDIHPIHRVALPIHRAGSSDRLLRAHNPSIDRIILCNTQEFHTSYTFLAKEALLDFGTHKLDVYFDDKFLWCDSRVETFTCGIDAP